MSATQHTPGPWALKVETGDISAHGGLIAETYNSDYTLTQDEANGHLIAAAPDLLAALVAIVQFADDHGLEQEKGGVPIVLAARVAIAKAEGRP